MGLPQYEDITARAGLEIGHAFRWGLWKTYVLFGFFSTIIFWIRIRFKKKISHLLLLSTIIGYIIVMNLHVITGFNIQSDHWSTRVALMINAIVLSYICYYLSLYFKKYFLSKRIEKFLVVSVVIFILFILSNIIGSQIIVEKKRAYLYTVPENKIQAYGWLDKNTPNNSVVMSPSLETSVDLPIFTHNRTFLSRASTTIGSDKEVLERFFIVNKIFGTTEEQLDELLQDPQVVRQLFAQKYDSRELDASLHPERYDYYVVPENTRLKIVEDYVQFEFLNEFSYRVDYIFVGPNEKEMGLDIEKKDTYELVYDSDEVEIYKINK